MNLSRRAVLGGLAAVPMVRIARGGVVHRLTVVHMNDFHSRHEPVGPSALNCKIGAPNCFGGAARLATAVAAERAAAEAAGRTVIFIDAGDQFQGSLFYTAWHGEVELAVMHAMGTEAMAVGNHEFDNGPATLARFVRAANFPVLSANTEASDEPDLAGLIKPHVILRRGALRIGVVGLTTQETATGSSPGPHVRFAPPGPALTASAAALRAQGAHVVLALSHLGVDEDRALAGHIAGVDAFIGGHSHTLLSDSEPGALGPAHRLFEGPAGRAVVVQAACYSRYVGRLDIDLDGDFVPVAYGGDVRHVGLDLAEEPRVAAIVAGYAAKLDGVRKQVVGHAAAASDITVCRIGECPLGDFVADAMRASVHGADIAIMNAGGLRTGLPAGDITLGDVLTMLPFGNSIATLKLSGAELLAALANGVSRAGLGGFPQISGAVITWNPLAPAAERLVSASIRGADGALAPIDPARIYTIVTNDFLRRGGDGYTPFHDHAIDPYDTGPGLDVVVATAIQSAPFAPTIDGRLVIGR